MPTSTIIRLMVAVTFMVTLCSADWWDDFSNNLAADLAPLLSLFGEQATKQFLSESTSILDNIIFALAPLGVITAVVSVIRVSGSPSLRAFIGRAQEGGGIVEAELCSSTSRNVCEMYHNGAVVRVFGRPKILEVIHDQGAEDFYDSPGDPDTSKPRCGIYSFEEYIATNGANKAGWTERGKGIVNNRPNSKATDPEKQAAGIEVKPADQQRKQQFAPNPNLSLNIGFQRASRGLLWMVIGIGFVAQASVTIFAIVVTRHLQWEKEDALPEPWGLPLMIAGTSLLSLGMFLCAHLIERSTRERHFTRRSASSKKNPDRKDVSMYVIQPGNQTIGDQTYDAFAYIKPDTELTTYTTSWKPIDDVPGTDAKPYETFWHAIKVWIAIITTIIGFILQFMGLRALHSAISVALLGAIAIMTIIRASLRTLRLKKEQNQLRDRPDQVVGHELDWLAMSMGFEHPKSEAHNNRTLFWSIISPSSTQTCPDIVFKEESQEVVVSEGKPNQSLVRRTAEGGKTNVYAFQAVGTCVFPPPDLRRALKTAEATLLKGIETGENESQKHVARRLFYYRSRLAEITTHSIPGKLESSRKWDVPIRKQVQQLKKAIEASVEILFAHGKFKPVSDDTRIYTRGIESSNAWKTASSFIWSLDVAVSRQSDDPTTFKSPSQIHIILRKATPVNGRGRNKWEVDEQSLEAVLGLWTWSLLSNPMTQRKDDFSLIQSAAYEVPTARITAIGESVKDIDIAEKEFACWFEELPSFIRPTKLPEDIQGDDLGAYSLWETKCHAGPKLELIKETPKSGYQYNLQQLRRMFGWPGVKLTAVTTRSYLPNNQPTDETNDEFTNKSTARFVLMAEVNRSIPTLCAQDVYQSFLSAMASVLDSLDGKTSLVEEPQRLYLTNEIMSKLVNLIVESGLGSEEDAKLILIPTLRSYSKLPAPTVVLPQAYRKADEHRHASRFKAAEKVLKWAYNIAIHTGFRDPNVSDMEATVLELAELYRYARRAEYIPTEHPPPHDFYLDGMKWLEHTKENLNTAPITEIVERYRWLNDYDFDIRRCPDITKVMTCLLEDLCQEADDSRLSCLLVLRNIGCRGQKEIDAFVKAKDKSKRSILSWAAQNGWREIVKACVELRCEVDAQDEKHWTPLMYAANHGHADIVHALMLGGANPATKVEKQLSPLWYASKNGFPSVIKVLLEDGSVDVNAMAKDGWSALHFAASSGHLEAIDVLLQNGAQLNGFGSFDQSAYVVALKCRQFEAAEYLRDLGSKFSSPYYGQILSPFLFESGNLRATVDSIQLQAELSARASDGEDIKALLCFHDKDCVPDAFPVEQFHTWQRAPAFGIIEVTKDGNSNPSWDTLVRAFQRHVVVKFGIIGLHPGTPTVIDDCFHYRMFNWSHFILDLMFYLKLDVTQALLESTAEDNSRQSEDFFLFLLERPKSKGIITQGLVKTVIGSQSRALVKLRHLIKSRGDVLRITTEILEEATKQEDAMTMMTLFLMIPGTESHVSTKILQEIARYHFCVQDYSLQKEGLSELLKRGLKEIVVSDVVLNAMLSNAHDRWDEDDENIVKILLDRQQGKVVSKVSRISAFLLRVNG